MKDTIESAVPGATLAAFEAGLKSQTASELFPGIIIHHKDLAVTDKTLERLKDAKRTNDGPKNPAGVLTLHTLESFAQAVKDNSDDRSHIFADTEAGKIVCVFDFLEKGGCPFDDKAVIRPRRSGWGQHSAEIAFRESRKLKEWRKTLEWMGQADFANFLEDHLEDIAEPSGQDLLAIATDLEASSTGNFKGRLNLDNGSVALNYQDDVETSVEIPRNLTLGIPLFEHGDRYKLKCRLRFLVRGGSVQFRLLFTNVEDAKEQEFERIVQEIEEKTGVVIYRGKLALPW